jgi:hypothetical protein
MRAATRSRICSTLLRTCPAYRRFLVYDALRACASDGDLAAEERERVAGMAAMMGLQGDVVDELEQIVQQGDALRRRLSSAVMADLPA